MNIIYILVILLLSFYYGEIKINYCCGQQIISTALCKKSNLIFNTIGNNSESSCPNDTETLSWSYDNITGLNNTLNLFKCKSNSLNFVYYQVGKCDSNNSDIQGIDYIDLYNGDWILFISCWYKGGEINSNSYSVISNNLINDTVNSYSLLFCNNDSLIISSKVQIQYRIPYNKSYICDSNLINNKNSTKHTTHSTISIITIINNSSSLLLNKTSTDIKDNRWKTPLFIVLSVVTFLLFICCLC